MTIPGAILLAVAQGGGKITLVVGAGCSLEDPTSIPLAKRCSGECHEQLVANGVLMPGDCESPDILSSLADAVFQKTGGKQGPLVEQLSQRYHLKAPAPNEGHEIAAALLFEGVVSSVVTLNFDLALSLAVGALGAGDVVGIIDGPNDMLKQRTSNLYYLHRNANADPEDWVLRTAVIKDNWKDRWDVVLVPKVIATPIVLFIGMGSPAEVFIDSAQKIRAVMPNGSEAYQVDPGASGASAFSQALSLPAGAHIQAGWCAFMSAVAQRHIDEQVIRVRAAATELVQQNGFQAEDISAFLDRLKNMSLIQVGRLRAAWLLDRNPYHPDQPAKRHLVADLILAATMVARETGTTAVPFENGLVEFRRGDRVVSSHVFVSGGGTRRRAAVESELSSRRRRYKGLATPPSGAVVAGTSDAAGLPVTPPTDLINGDAPGDIVSGAWVLPMFHTEVLRQNPTLCQGVAP